MKRKEAEKGSFSENVGLIKRALSIISQLSPNVLKLNVIKAFIDALTPYIAICMSLSFRMNKMEVSIFKGLSTLFCIFHVLTKVDFSML